MVRSPALLTSIYFLIDLGLQVFLTFWQATFLSVLGWFNVLKAVSYYFPGFKASVSTIVLQSKYMTEDDVITAISAILETFEMM